MSKFITVFLSSFFFNEYVLQVKLLYVVMCTKLLILKRGFIFRKFRITTLGNTSPLKAFEQYKDKVKRLFREIKLTVLCRFKGGD